MNVVEDTKVCSDCSEQYDMILHFRWWLMSMYLLEVDPVCEFTW